MVFIQDYIKTKLKDEGVTSNNLAMSLGICLSMLSAYKSPSYNASLTVAKKVYANDGIVLHPFSEISLKYELEKDNG